MKLPHLLIAFSLFSCIEIGHSQEWRLYSSSDAVDAFSLYHDDIWAISGSGLSKINIYTGDKQTWNTLNSDLPDYRMNVMSVDSAGTIWMGIVGEITSKIIRFNGNSFETITDINGHQIHNILDIETTPDGKVWIYAHTSPVTLYRYEQNQFTTVPLPPGNFVYGPNAYSRIGVDDESHIWTVLVDTLLDQRVISEYDGQQWTIHDASSTGVIPRDDYIWGHDHQGNIYVLLKDLQTPELLKYDGSQWSQISLPALASETRYVFHPMYVDRQGQIWLTLTNNTILRYDGNSWTTLDLNDFGFSNGEPDQLLLDQQDHWWMRYLHHDAYYKPSYLYQFDGVNSNKVDLSNSSLPSNSLQSIVVDELNNKWSEANLNLLKFDGQQWTSIPSPDENTYPNPIGSNRNGGVWLYPPQGNSALEQFDGVTISTIPISKPDGAPFQFPNFYMVDQHGRFIGAYYDPQVVVFDHGKTNYLDSILYEYSPGEFFLDYPYGVAIDSTDHIYVMGGTQLYRLETDSSWTSIPLWDNFEIGYLIAASPDNKIWALDTYYLTYEYKFWIYDGLEWTPFESPMELQSMPTWDNQGNPWFKTEQGLCKFANGSWECFNRTNSPIIPERIISFALDKYNNIWITLNDGGLLVFNEDYIHNIDGHDLPLVSGVVYRDVNQNGILDGTDPPLALQRQLLLPDSIIAFSNLSGNYHISSPSGDHEVKYLPRPNWHIDNSPSSYEITVAQDPITDLDFNLQPDHEVIDLRLFLNEGYPRCTHYAWYWLSYSNLGTSSESGEVIFIKDPKTQISYYDPMPTYVSGDTVHFAFSDLQPFASGQIQMDIHIPGPSDTALVFSGFLDRLVNNMPERQDSFHVQQDIKCSFDPNDKIARTVRSAGDGKSYLDDPLFYTIRFQNTGNDTAYTIVVRDTLDEDLDLNTVEIISASHPYEAFLKPDRTLEFRFMNIHLPDSTTNELESHGYVSYSIKAKSGLASPTIIDNTAHIYFDFNEAVRTNTATNELIEFGTGIYDEKQLITIIKAFPNPTSDELIIEAMTEDTGPITYTLLNMHGQALESGVIHSKETRHISLSKLPSGLYIVKATDGVSSQSVIVVKG